VKWRIVHDRYLGYEVQYKRWWWPFWIQHGGCNSFLSLDRAKAYLDRHANPVVYEHRETNTRR